MKKLRILCLVLAMLMMLSALAACNDGSTDGTEGDDETPATVLNLVSQSTTEYVIVYDKNASADLVKNVETLVKAFSKYLNCTIKTQLCYNNIENHPDEKKQEKEILIGVTNRQESITALSNIKHKDYVMGVFGSKLVIGSNYDGSTTDAIAYFLNHFVYEVGDQYAPDTQKFDFTFSSDDNLRKEGKYSYSSFTINGINIKDFQFIYSNDKAATKDEYKAFAEELVGYLNFHVGHTLNVYHSSTEKRKAELEIIIGSCADRTSDDGLVEKLGAKGYHIEVVTGDEGTKLVILYGSAGREAAMNAFKEIVMPSSTKTVTKDLPVGICASQSK